MFKASKHLEWRGARGQQRSLGCRWQLSGRLGSGEAWQVPWIWARPGRVWLISWPREPQLALACLSDSVRERAAD